MDFLIIYKWLKDWGYGNPHAPSIITTMINLPLAMGKTVSFYLQNIGQIMLSWWIAYVGCNRINFTRRLANAYPNYFIYKHSDNVVGKANLFDKKNEFSS